MIVEASPTPILDENANMVGIVGVSWDISEKKKLEAERRKTDEVLRNSERQLVEAQKLAHVGSWERDLETGVVTLSDEGARMFFGDERRRISSFNELAEFVHPDDREYVRRSRATEETKAPVDLEYRIVRADGAVRVLHTRSEVVRNESGQADPVGRIRTSTSPNATRPRSSSAKRESSFKRSRAGCSKPKRPRGACSPGSCTTISDNPSRRYG